MDKVVISNLGRLKTKLENFDWLATIPDDRYCECVHPTLMEITFSLMGELGADLTEGEEFEANQPFFDAVNESFLRYQLDGLEETNIQTVINRLEAWAETETNLMQMAVEESVENAHRNRACNYRELVKLLTVK